MEISCWEVVRYTVRIFRHDRKREQKHFYTEEAALDYIKQAAETCAAYSLTVTKIAQFM